MAFLCFTATVTNHNCSPSMWATSSASSPHQPGCSTFVLKVLEGTCHTCSVPGHAQGCSFPPDPWHRLQTIPSQVWRGHLKGDQMANQEMSAQQLAPAQTPEPSGADTCCMAQQHCSTHHAWWDSLSAQQQMSSV